MNLNRIFWQNDKIGLLTNHLEADTHAHWMLQLFISIEDSIEIMINDKMIQCHCIVIDKNIPHAFSANQKIYFSAIIEPDSSYAKQLFTRMNEHGYWINDNMDRTELRKQANLLIQSPSKEEYLNFISILDTYLKIEHIPITYDERITELLHHLASCSCDNHTIAAFADQVALSPSRLSHLFKEQMGIPLKNYLLLHQMETAFKALFDGSTISEAAMQAGFDSPSHFASTVKRMMGMSVSSSLKDSVFLKV